MNAVRLFELTKKMVVCFDGHTLVVKRFGVGEFFTIPVKDLRLVELKRVIGSKWRICAGGAILTATTFGAVLLVDPWLRLSMVLVAGGCLRMMSLDWRGDIQILFSYKEAGHHRGRPEKLLLPRYTPKDWTTLNEIAQLVNNHIHHDTNGNE